jgi:hypothetical protein
MFDSAGLTTFCLPGLCILVGNLKLDIILDLVITGEEQKVLEGVTDLRDRLRKSTLHQASLFFFLLPGLPAGDLGQS